MNNQQGYTLFELLAVIVILGILTGLGFLVYTLIHFIMKMW